MLYEYALFLTLILNLILTQGWFIRFRRPLSLTSGYCVGVPLDSQEAFIASFAVTPELRQKGIGTQLLNRVIESLGDRYISFYATVQAESFYKKFGFTTGDKPSYLQQVCFIPNRDGLPGKH